MEALVFTKFPINPAVAKARETSCLSSRRDSCKYRSTAGTTPHAPHVGAVTTAPPDAFCSDTANAYALINAPGAGTAALIRVAFR
jgi:hypothetical protein